jgi:hypothetical protein
MVQIADRTPTNWNEFADAKGERARSEATEVIGLEPTSKKTSEAEWPKLATCVRRLFPSTLST